MIGEKVIHKTIMAGVDGHYVGNLVNGTKMLDYFGDVATELLVRVDGDLSLLRSYKSVDFLAPVHVGDFMEYHGWIEKKGNTSYEVHCEAWKVITMPDDFKIKHEFLDGVQGEPNLLHLKDTAAIVCDPPILCGKAVMVLIIPKDCQRGPQDPRFAE